MKDDYIQSGRSNQKLETRNRILAGARYFLAKKNDFTLEDIAKHIKISRATIYRYYSNIDLLISEAGISVPQDSQSIIDSLEKLDLPNKILGIQDYYNQLTLTNEPAFRKYLSTNICSPQTDNKRGARRIETLKLALDQTSLNQKEKTKLAHLFTLFMGVEPMIITKDVCGLSNKKSKELLIWGLQLMLKSVNLENN